ncbi:DEAD/DEAH box helicase, partial [bacterium]|nr:DEAD/DEAH box helicase [bacterium]
MNSVESLISSSASSYMKTAIDETGGNEVFFQGYTDENGIIADVDVLARGNEVSVPAIIDMLTPGSVVIHNHPSGFLEPSQDDINIASFLGNQGIGVYIVNNDITNIYVVVEKYDEEEKTPLDVDELSGHMEPGGSVSRYLNNYEFRKGQINMMAKTAGAFNENKIQIIEAGTGIGKTLAYLIPAVRWSMDNNERCVVSTHTINLQEQIMNKDIPFLKNALDVDFKAVLIKGRNNYVCLRKVDAEIREMPNLLVPEEKEELKSLLEWARLTQSGDKSELTVTPKAENWERVCCEADTCIRVKCPFYEKCFLVRVRREAALSNILIVNHHLLFADIYVRSKVGQFNDIAILPPYSRLILDEAHHIEDVATDYFGLEVARGGIIRLMGRIYSERRPGESKGVISLLRTKLILKNKGGLKKQITPIINIIEDKIIPQKNVIISLSDDIFDSIAQVVRFGSGQNSESRKRRIKKDVTDSEIWVNAVIPGIKTLQKNLKGFKKMLKELKESLDTLPRDVYKDFEDRMIELYAQHDRVEELQQKLQKIFISDESGRVK